jgi:hypothetical protein
MLYAISFIIGVLYGIVLTLGVFLPRKPQGRMVELKPGTKLRLRHAYEEWTQEKTNYRRPW